MPVVHVFFVKESMMVNFFLSLLTALLPIALYLSCCALFLKTAGAKIGVVPSEQGLIILPEATHTSLTLYKVLFAVTGFFCFLFILTIVGIHKEIFSGDNVAIDHFKNFIASLVSLGAVLVLNLIYFLAIRSSKEALDFTLKVMRYFS